MSDSESNASLNDTVTNAGKWTTERIRLLIQLRLEMELQFRSGRSRHLLWPQIYTKLKSADPSITETLKGVQKKFNNLMLTYKRISSTPRRQHNQSRWEFFDDFDEILSQFGDTPDENDHQSNVRYVKVEDKVDDDSVSFSSDDGDTPSIYKNVVTYKPKSPVKQPTVQYTQAANGIKAERLSVAHVKEPENVPNKRKLLTETSGTVGVSRIQKKIKHSTMDAGYDVNAWMKEFAERSERQEQIRCEQHQELLELERKRIEIETKNSQMLRELVDVVKKFVNK